MTVRRKQRKRNTHDPKSSNKEFVAAMAAAERELLAAGDRLEKRQVAGSIWALNKTSYWLGRARCQLRYSEGTKISKADKDRLSELEGNMKSWGKNFDDWMRD